MLMANFFEKKDRWGNGLALWVVVGMAFLIPISLWSLLSLRMENEVEHWIPKDNPDYMVVEWYRRHFPADDVVLFTWEGSSLEDPRVDRLVRKIRGMTDATGKRRGGSKLIEKVRTPHDLIAQMRKNKVSRDEALRHLEGVLVGSGPVRIRLSEFGRARRDKVINHLRLTARDSLGIEIEVATPESEKGPDAIDATADFSAETDVAATAAASSSPAETADSAGTSGEEVACPPADDASAMPPHDLLVTWRGMHWDAAKKSAFMQTVRDLRLPANKSPEPSPKVVDECFQVPGSPIALAVYLSEAGNADRNGAFRWLFAAAQEAGIPQDKIHMGGSAVAGASLNREVLKSVWDTSVPSWQIHRRSIILLSGLVGGILSFWLLRSFKLAGLVLAVSYFTTLLSTALVPVTGGSMNMVLVVMPTLILVTTLSVAIHLANYWRHAAAADLKTAVTTAIKTAFVPCLWAGMTSAIGQLSLLTSSLAPIRDFGLYSAAGTLISLGVTLYGLPALLQIWPGKPPRTDDLDSAFWHTLAAWVAARHKFVTAVCLAGSALLTWGLVHFKTEVKVIRYFSESTRTVKDYEFIEDRLAGIVPVDVIIRFDRESQQQLKFLQRRDLVQKIQADMAKLPDISGSLSLVDFLPAVPPPSEHASVREKARYSATSRTIEARVKGEKRRGASSLLAVADDATEFNAEGDELWRVTAQVAIMSDRNYQDLRSQIDRICSAVLCGTSGNAVDKVPPVGAKRCYHPGASHVVTGEIPLFLATQQELLESFIWSFTGAFGSIALVVMCVLRHPVAGFLAMIPNVLPIGAIFGVISWYGLPVDIGSTVTASIALGITIDGTLHLITWFRLGIQQGKSRAEAVSLALGHCGPAMWQTTLVVSLGLLMLLPADLILISRFGWLMSALLGAASVSDLVLTPALLAGPLGYIIERCTPVDPAVAKENAASEAAPEPTVSRAAEPLPGKPHIGTKTVRIRRVD
ncbi:MAG: efflux RND transporter permease subunit [Deltaproteobacteria bacterium]